MVPKNIERFRETQLKKVGLMIDWDHQVDTTSPEYYRWTQWMFVTLFKNGLAYRKRAAVNWCPSCMTVLAAEQVIDGQCERCQSEVTKKEMAQWFFKTTAFAQELLDELDTLDWSERTKLAQRNWIGRSQGAEVTFQVDGGPSFSVFTTRPDTLFGATYIVFSPEHPLVDEITTPERAKDISDYRQGVMGLTEVERQAEGREKTGAFTGAMAINPVNGEKIPVWVADYVLMGYGTGAIMAVPAHDQRDHEFALKFGLPIREVVSGGEESVDISKQAYPGDGKLVNSGEFNGLEAKTEGVYSITKMLEKRGLASFTTNYRLRDWCVSRQRYWGPPIPIVYCQEHGEVPVPEQDLPVLLPKLADYRPDGSGLSPLARDASFHKTVCPICGKEALRETDVSDNFLCSSWYFIRYPSTGFDDRPFDQELTKKWLPVDLYVGGNEHAVLHLLYSRWLCRALNKCGFLGFAEPYKRFVAHGMIVKNGAKMSKSRGNIVNPDDYINEFGADSFRMYLMFMGAYLEGGDFRDGGVRAMKAFLDRLLAAALPEGGEPLDPAPPSDRETLFWLNSTVRSVGADLSRFSYNTAIARLMELVNHLTKNKVRNKKVSETLAQLLAPLAPHLAEEIWEALGHKVSVFRSSWPPYDETACQKPEVEYVIQVNGKVRGKLSLAAGLPQEEIEPLVMGNDTVAKWLEGKAIVKKIYVPDKLVNLVVK
jgi:leucyl-tRNA synthetase